MTSPLTSLALLAITALVAGSVGAGATSPGAGADDPIMLGQLTVHERITIRIPRLSHNPAGARMPIPVPPIWREKKGPKCVAAADLAGALISQPGSVDLVLTGGDRVRAVFDRHCGPLDFYGGYYIRPAADGSICADRDVIRVRSGGSCTIAKFRQLVAAR